MKELLALGVVGLLFISGCSTQEKTQEDQSGPQTSVVTMNVSDGSGLPADGVTVVAEHSISADKWSSIAEATTDENGNATLTLPENITARVGLWKQNQSQPVDVGETNYVPPSFSWQTPFIVPVDDTSLSYQYWIDHGCPVVTPGTSEPCPVVSTPTPSVTP